MVRIGEALGDVDTLDRLASGGAAVHRLDPRAKVIATALYLITVVSFSRYEVAELLPLAIFPAALLVGARVPGRIVLRYLLAASPFAVLLGVFNIFLDRRIVAEWGPLAVSGGWMSFLSMLVRFLLTVSGALALLACTGFLSTCAALGRMGMPRLLVMQFMLLYRFIFVLLDEAARMVRARDLRAVGGRGRSIRVWGSLAGHLLLRAYDRGLRVHQAMLARGFDGTIRSSRVFRWSAADTAFLAVWVTGLAAARFGHVAERLGQWLTGSVG